MRQTLFAATVATLFAVPAPVIAQSSSPRIDASSSAGGASAAAASSPLPSANSPSSRTPSTMDRQCQLLVGMEKERCLRERGGTTGSSAAGGSSRTPGTGSAIGSNAPGTGRTGATGMGSGTSNSSK